MNHSLLSIADVRCRVPWERPDRLAFFLDLDGTIARLADTPDAVGPEDARSDLLSGLLESLGGRLAVISGRTIDNLDFILEGKVAAMAGVHGLERRSHAGGLSRSDRPDKMAAVRDVLVEYAANRPGLLVEDKGASIALHYRVRPGDEPAVLRLTGRLAEASGLRIQKGHMVAEVRAPGPDKGDAVAAFMAEPPFEHSTPVFVGDDITDEDAFRRVKVLGGAGILVGADRPTAACFRLPGVDEALMWLESLRNMWKAEAVAR